MKTAKRFVQLLRGFFYTARVNLVAIYDSKLLTASLAKAIESEVFKENQKNFSPKRHKTRLLLLIDDTHNIYRAEKRE